MTELCLRYGLWSDVSFKSRSINQIHSEDQESIIDTSHRFIFGVEQFKQMKRKASFSSGF